MNQQLSWRTIVGYSLGDVANMPIKGGKSAMAVRWAIA